MKIDCPKCDGAMTLAEARAQLQPVGVAVAATTQGATQRQGAGMDIPEDRYREIEAMIDSAESPVGIDAKKTHVIIIYKLMEIERRLAELESKG